MINVLLTIKIYQKHDVVWGWHADIGTFAAPGSARGGA
jgi:hypothetical protein